VGASAEAISIWGGNKFTNLRIQNNNFYQNGNNGVLFQQGLTPGSGYINSGNTVQVPGFVGGTNYTLAAGSLMIDAGINVGLPYNGAALIRDTLNTPAGKRITLGKRRGRSNHYPATSSVTLTVQVQILMVPFQPMPGLKSPVPPAALSPPQALLQQILPDLLQAHTCSGSPLRII